MDNTLQEFLLSKGYKKIKLKLTRTNHFEIKATINNAKGVFILDTGASSSCIGFENIELFNLKVKDSKIKAAGAGTTDMVTQISRRNTIKIGRWKISNSSLILFDLTHINTALINQETNAVNGIIGADILKKGKGIIDYEKKYLYLKPL
ncbi:retropepsin-like aspartic protease [Pontimicrobium sp. MEBiC01747]|jgi:predicted aspartyl protease